MNIRHFTLEQIDEMELEEIDCVPWRWVTMSTYVFPHDGTHWMVTIRSATDGEWQDAEYGWDATEVAPKTVTTTIWEPK